MGGLKPALASLSAACILASSMMPGAAAAQALPTNYCGGQMPAAFYEAVKAYAQERGLDITGAPGEIELVEHAGYYGAYESPLSIVGIEKSQNPDVRIPYSSSEARPGRIVINCELSAEAIADVYIHEALGHGVLTQEEGTELRFPAVIYTLELQETPEPPQIMTGGKELQPNRWYLAFPDDPAFPVLALNENGSLRNYTAYTLSDWEKISEIEPFYVPSYLWERLSDKNQILFLDGAANMEGRLGKLMLPSYLKDGSHMSFQPSNELIYEQTEVIARILQEITNGNVTIAEDARRTKEIGDSSIIDYAMEGLYDESRSPDIFNTSNYTQQMELLGEDAVAVYKIVGDDVMLDLIYGLEGRGGLTFPEGMEQLSADPEAAEGLAFARYAFGELPYRLLLNDFLSNGAERMERDSALMSDVYSLIGKVFPQAGQKQLMERYFEEGFHLSAEDVASLDGSYASFSEAAFDGSKLVTIERFKQEDFTQVVSKILLDLGQEQQPAAIPAPGERRQVYKLTTE